MARRESSEIIFTSTNTIHDGIRSTIDTKISDSPFSIKFSIKSY
jgi:hypothetical protein